MRWPTSESSTPAGTYRPSAVRRHPGPCARPFRRAGPTPGSARTGLTTRTRGALVDHRSFMPRGFPPSRGPNPGSSWPVDDVLVTPTDALRARSGVPSGHRWRFHRPAGETSTCDPNGPGRASADDRPAGTGGGADGDGVRVPGQGDDHLALPDVEHDLGVVGRQDRADGLVGVVGLARERARARRRRPARGDCWRGSARWDVGGRPGPTTVPPPARGPRRRPP